MSNLSPEQEDAIRITRIRCGELDEALAGIASIVPIAYVEVSPPTPKSDELFEQSINNLRPAYEQVASGAVVDPSQEGARRAVDAAYERSAA